MSHVIGIVLGGSKTAQGVLRSAGRALGIAIASMALTLNIELFVIGGGVALARRKLIEGA